MASPTKDLAEVLRRLKAMANPWVREAQARFGIATAKTLRKGKQK